jgi:hypothetical protein
LLKNKKLERKQKQECINKEREEKRREGGMWDALCLAFTLMYPEWTQIQLPSAFSSNHNVRGLLKGSQHRYCA